MYRRLASPPAPRGWLQIGWASVNRSESQIIAAATADFRARGINIKLDALSRSSDVVKVRICFGLALWLASCQRDVDPSLLAVQWSRVGTLTREADILSNGYKQWRVSIRYLSHFASHSTMSRPKTNVDLSVRSDFERLS